MQEETTNRQEMSTVLRESTTREQLAQMSQALVKLQRIHQSLHETIEELQEENKELHAELSDKYTRIKELEQNAQYDEITYARLRNEYCSEIRKIPVWIRMFCGVNIQLDKE